MSTENDILGTGWSFPPRFDKVQMSPKMLNGVEDIENSIYVIIHTKLGERILRNDFGSNIHDLLFEPLNANMKTYMSSSLKSSLIQNEPRIEIEQIELEQSDQTVGRVDIHIQFSIIETQVSRNLVVPFYTPDNISLN